MGRASFGGAQDYSSLFAAVFGNQQAEAKSAADQAAYDAKVAEQQAKQAAAEAKANQAAADQDAADMWANGAMSNDQWLAYIAQRVDQTAGGDPKEHEKWVKYQRKYTQDIAVSTAEFNFANGGSINELIAFYTNLVAGKEPSTDTQKDVLRLNELIDQKTSTDVTTGAQAIIDRINAGTGTYDELLAFEKKALTYVRSGSALEQQIKEQIVKVTDTIKTGKSEAVLAKAEYDFNSGHITGKQYAKIITQQAEQYKTTDPKKYYQFLGAANEYVTKNPGLVGQAGRASAARAAASKAATTAHDQNETTRNWAYYYVDAYEKGKRQVPDPANPNKTVILTDAFIRKQDQAVLKSFDSDAAIAKSRGDLSSASNYATKKLQYVDIAVSHNTHSAEEIAAHTMSARYAALPHLSGNVDTSGETTGAEDPYKAQATFNQWIAKEKANLNKATNFTTTRTIPIDRRFGEGTTAKQTVIGAEKAGANAVDPAYVARQTVVINAMERLNSGADIPDAEVQQIMGELMTAYGVDDPMKLPQDIRLISRAMLNNSNNLAGLLSGNRALVINTAGRQQWVSAAPTTVENYTEKGTTVSGPQYDYTTAGLTGDATTKLVDVIVDVNGVPTHRKAIATLAQSNLNVWKVKKDGLTIKENGRQVKVPAGTILTNAQVEAAYKQYGNDWTTDPSLVAQTPALNYYHVTVSGATNAKGQALEPEVWTEDPLTHQWIKGRKLDLRSVSTAVDGTVQVDKNHNPIMQFAPDSGYAVPYIGINVKGAQDVLNAKIANGTFDPTGLRGRDALGNLTDAPSRNPAYSFYDPITTSLTTHRDNWYADEQKQREADAAKLRYDQLAGKRKDDLFQVRPDIQGKPPTEEDRFDPMKKFGESIGLNFGVPKKPVYGPPATPKININVATGFTIPPVRASVPNLSTGPQINASTGFTITPSYPKGTGFTPTYKPPTMPTAPTKPSSSAPTVKLPTAPKPSTTPNISATTGFTLPPKPPATTSKPKTSVPKPRVS